MKTTKPQKRALLALNLDLFAPETLKTPAPATIHSRILDLAVSRPIATDELMAPDGHELPDEAELVRRFDIFNWQYFQGRLKPPRIQYSTRMKAAGSYSPHDHLIKIGRPYHEIFPQDINDTLKHEMIHLTNLKHDRRFKAEAERIGTTVKARYHPSLIRPPKYVYACPECSKQYPRQKRLIMASCGYCSKNLKYNARYKLRLVNSGKK